MYFLPDIRQTTGYRISGTTLIFSSGAPLKFTLYVRPYITLFGYHHQFCRKYLLQNDLKSSNEEHTGCLEKIFATFITYQKVP